jgi:predicted Fe-Mo cluster-binding NifX family protein
MEGLFAMKIAIPTFATRVSPRFDCARSLMVVTLADGAPAERQEFVSADWGPHERISKLRELGVEAVICGGIDRWSVDSLRSTGITVYGWVTGEVDDALTALLKGDLDAEAVTERGGRCCCRRFAARPNGGPPESGGRGAGGGGRGRGRRAGPGGGRGRGT